MGRVGVCLTILMALAAPAWGQSRNIEVTFGFSGEVVAEAWNPLRVTVRDQPDLELLIDIDYGTLREGTQRFEYRATLAGGSGLRIVEDDIFIPAWRSFTWQVRSDAAILASGSIDRRLVDPRPLTLLVAAQPGAYRELFPREARLVEVRASELPERAAAYAGVEALLVAASFEQPRREALLAAAAAGSHVLLAEEDPTLTALLKDGPKRLGAGWLSTAEPHRGLARLELAALTEALITPALSRTPDNLPPLNLVVVAAAYLLVILLLVRFGGMPGLLSCFGLTVLVSAVAWVVLRPAEETLIRSRSLIVSAGGLAYEVDVLGVFSYPAQTLTLEREARPLSAASWRLSPGELALPIPRWSSLVLVSKPRLRPAALEWHDGDLVNRGTEALGEVFIVGLGAQAPLPAGAIRPPEHLADPIAPPLYEPLVPLLPEGTALGRNGGRIYVALPGPEGGL